MVYEAGANGPGSLTFGIVTVATISAPGASISASLQIAAENANGPAAEAAEPKRILRCCTDRAK